MKHEMNELTEIEMEAYAGGILQLVAGAGAALLSIAVAGIVADWSDFKEGLQEGWNFAKN